MKFGPFEVDEGASDETYLYVDFPGGTVVIKLENEGVVVDVYPRRVRGGYSMAIVGAPVASTWCTYADLNEASEE